MEEQFEFGANAFDDRAAESEEALVASFFENGPVEDLLSDEKRLLAFALVEDQPEILAGVSGVGEDLDAAGAFAFTADDDLHLVNGGCELPVAFALRFKAFRIRKGGGEIADSFFEGEIFDGMREGEHGVSVHFVEAVGGDFGKWHSGALIPFAVESPNGCLHAEVITDPMKEVISRIFTQHVRNVVLVGGADKCGNF
jgi:hypothetical protein